MERGYTLVEMAVAVGIVAMLVLAGAAFAFGSRPMAMRSAAVQFGAQLRAAKSLAAASGNGATIIVRPSGSSGFAATVYSGRPTRLGALTLSNIAPVTSDASVTEASVGAPAFSIFISGGGHVSMARGDILGTALASEPACPAAGKYTLTFSANGAFSAIVLPCTLAVSGTPLSILTNSPAPTPPSSTPTPSPTPTGTPQPADTPTPTPNPLPSAAGTETPTPTPTPIATPCSSCGSTLLNTSGRWAMGVGGCDPRTGTCRINKFTRMLTVMVPVAPSMSPVHVFFSYRDASTADSYFPGTASIVDPQGGSAGVSGTGFWQGDIASGPAGTYLFSVEQGCMDNGNGVGTQNCSIDWTFAVTQ